MFKKKIIQTTVLSVAVLVLSSGVVIPMSNQSILAASDQPVENQALLQKQREIDQYVFEQHKAEIEQHGFKVTHTGQTGEYVEVGITPYSEENATYLYGLFGKERVKVVEGQQAVLMTSDAAANKSSNSTLPLPLFYIIGGVIALGGIGVYATRKMGANR